VVSDVAAHLTDGAFVGSRKHFVLLRCFRWSTYINEALLFLAEQWYFHKIWNVVSVRTFVLRNPLFGRVRMNKEDLYLSFAADCQQMASISRNQHERLTWLDMAQSWLHLALLRSIQLQPHFNKSHRNAA
jgi:hypothetical protein